MIFAQQAIVVVVIQIVYLGVSSLFFQESLESSPI